MSTSRSDQTYLFHLAREALTHWGWAPETSLTLIKFRENAVFGATSPDGKRAVVRLHRPNYHSKAALLSELLWTQALHRAGVPTAQALPATTGDLLIDVTIPDVPDTYYVDMLDWIDGEPVGSAEQRGNGASEDIETLYREVGKLAARIHDHSCEWDAPSGFWRPSWDLTGCIGNENLLRSPKDQPLWGDYNELAALSPEQRVLLSEAADRVREILTAFGTTKDRYGLVHADLVPDNVMKTVDNLRVIDFDDCGYGWYLWELATAVFWHIGEPTYDAARNGYIAGYREIRNLPDDHLDVMPAMLVMRALVYLGWMHSRRHTETARDHTEHTIHLSIKLARELLAQTGAPRADSAGSQCPSA